MIDLRQTAAKLWRELPEPVTHSALGRQLHERARRIAPGSTALATPPDAVRVVRTVEELDEVITELEAAWAVSDDELRRHFPTFRMELDLPFPPDPFSRSYRDAVLAHYELLHGAPYTAANEHTELDPVRSVVSPFPYCTESCATVGAHLVAIGRVIRALDLPPRSRVLELGAGWGNLALALAQMGHTVTTVDIGRNLVDLLAERARMARVPIEVVQGDFSSIHAMTGPFDAVVFFESFHHCLDHGDLVAALDGVVSPGGRVVFAAEPVSASWPVPWGLRLDGESVWAIRKHGWMELGFSRDYFDTLLASEGWTTSDVADPWATGIPVVVARRSPAG